VSRVVLDALSALAADLFQQGKRVDRGLARVLTTPLDYVSVQNWTWQQNILQANTVPEHREQKGTKQIVDSAAAVLRHI
jgi:hypothetical protein